MPKNLLFSWSKPFFSLFFGVGSYPPSLAHQVLPPAWSHGNPIDVLGDATARHYADSLAVVAEDPNCDGFLVILTPQVGFGGGVELFFSSGGFHAVLKMGLLVFLFLVFFWCLPCVFVFWWFYEAMTAPTECAEALSKYAKIQGAPRFLFSGCLVFLVFLFHLVVSLGLVVFVFGFWFLVRGVCPVFFLLVFFGVNCFLFFFVACCLLCWGICILYI